MVNINPKAGIAHNAIVIIADSAHGQYIPQYAAECLSTEWTGLCEETRELLKAGPEHDYYWETWETVLDNAEYKDKNGNIWRLYHDGDLFAVCDEIMSVKQYTEFYGVDP